MTTLDEYRHLTDAVLLRERGLFVAEGRLVVRRAIESGYRIHSLLLNDSAARDLSDILGRLSADVAVDVQPTAAFETITGFNFHRGCLALIHRPAVPTVDDVVGGAVEAESADRHGPIVMLEEVANADNVGGVFRNAAAFGAKGVVLSPGCCDPLYRKAVRTSMAAVLRVPFARADDWPAALDAARTARFAIVALTPRDPAEPIDAFARRAANDAKIALVIGSEAAGVSAATEAAADIRTCIPMDGGVDSLNLSVAAGIALYALRNRDARRLQPAAAEPPMSHGRKTAR